MKIGIMFGIITLIFTVITTTFTGCSFDKWVKVTEGNYVPIDAGETHDDSWTRLINNMIVNRDKDTIEIRLIDGTIKNTTFTMKPRKEWPSGCPANIGSTRMEVLDLEVDELVIGHIVLRSPTLVRDCPQNPERVILREDGQIGGSGTACAGNNKCIHFQLGSLAEPIHKPHELTKEDEEKVIQIVINSSDVKLLWGREALPKRNLGE